VTTTFGEGEVFIQNEGGELFRLRWKKDQIGEERLLPPGTYRLKGYRIVRGDWFVSTTSGSRAVQLEQGETTELEIEPRVHVGLTAKSLHGKTHLQMTILGENRMGLTIYRGGARIPMRYSVEADGEELASGTMRYG